MAKKKDVEIERKVEVRVVNNGYIVKTTIVHYNQKRKSDIDNGRVWYHNEWVDKDVDKMLKHLRKFLLEVE